MKQRVITYTYFVAQLVTSSKELFTFTVVSELQLLRTLTFRAQAMVFFKSELIFDRWINKTVSLEYVEFLMKLFTGYNLTINISYITV